MTLIDQAVMKVFQRREHASVQESWSTLPSIESDASVPKVLVSPEGPAASESKRELFVHAPETRLRGLHHFSRHEPRTVGPVTSSSGAPTDQVTDQDAHASSHIPEREPVLPQTVSAVAGVMNHLLSYELSIQGPRLDAWEIATETPLAAMPLSSPEPVVGTSPEPRPIRSAPAPFRPAWETDAFRMTEMCRQIRAEMQDHLQKAAAQLIDDCVANRPVVNVTGCCRAEGRTTVSILLASALAKAGLRVILVDGDFANPDLAEHLGVAVDGGWHAGLNALEEVAECCVYSMADGFSVLSLDPTDSSEAPAAAAGLTALLRGLAAHFDIILVDSGIRSTEHVSWPEDLLGTHVMVRDRRSDDPLVWDDWITKLGAAGQSVIRVVENFAQPQRI